MYKNIKYLGHTLEQWRDDVFKNTFNLGELYRMMKDGVDFNKITPPSSK